MRNEFVVANGIRFDWADEATGAANDPETAQAREHDDEDLGAAQGRAELAATGPHLTLIRRVARRLGVLR